MSAQLPGRQTELWGPLWALHGPVCRLVLTPLETQAGLDPGPGVLRATPNDSFLPIVSFLAPVSPGCVAFVPRQLTPATLGVFRASSWKA